MVTLNDISLNRVVDLGLTVPKLGPEDDEGSRGSLHPRESRCQYAFARCEEDVKG